MGNTLQNELGFRTDLLYDLLLCSHLSQSKRYKKSQKSAPSNICCIHAL
jgi:hypothetical protein